MKVEMGEFTFFNEKIDCVNDAARTVHIKSDISEANELFKIYANLLDFPDYFGYNWNAFEECINDLEWISEYEIVIIHDDLPFKNSYKEKKVYVEILSCSTAIWQVDSGHKLVVAFPKKYQEEVKLLNTDWLPKEAKIVQFEREQRDKINKMQKNRMS